MRKQVKISPKVNNELLLKGLLKYREDRDFSSFRMTGLKEPFDNQIDCALDILCTFSNKRPRHNYVIVKGNTQAGKTGVFVSLINIIYNMKLYYSYLDINKIFYITGDNSVQIKKQTTGNIAEGCLESMEEMAENGLEIIILKQSDMKLSKWSKLGITSFENAMFFIDESHYGSRKEKNTLPTWLKMGGLSLRNDSDLIKKKVYIISNSATPYGEIESDLIQSKQYVTLKPGKGYKGLWDFNYDSVYKNIFNCDDETINKYLSKWYRHLARIEKNGGKTKCILARIDDKKLNENIDLIENYFDVVKIDSSGGNINYPFMESTIVSYCKCGFNRRKVNRKKKFLMVVVKGGLRMGVRIGEEAKNYIGIIYDFTSTKLNVVATEQGLWGRICGYRKGKDYKDTLVCVNKAHEESLLSFYLQGNIYIEGKEYPSEGKIARTPFTITKSMKEYEYDENDHSKEYVKKFKKGTKFDEKEWHPIAKRFDFESMESDYYENWSVSPQEWFESKVGTDFFKGFKKFQLEDLLTPDFKYFETFVKPFLIEQDEFYKDAQILGTRRYLNEGQKDVGFCKSFKTSPPLLNSSAYTTYLEGKIGISNIGRTAYRAMLDVRDLSKIRICTVIGEIAWGKSIEKTVTIPMKKDKLIAETMNTSMAI